MSLMFLYRYKKVENILYCLELHADYAMYLYKMCNYFGIQEDECDFLKF